MAVTRRLSWNVGFREGFVNGGTKLKDATDRLCLLDTAFVAEAKMGLSGTSLIVSCTEET